MSTTHQAFEAAFEHHRAGRFAEAAALYQQVLRATPQHADALHLLGVVAHQTGQHELAVTCISRAIAVRGNDPAFHANLGEVLAALGKSSDAERSYRQALRLEGGSPSTHLRLGDLYRRQGQIDRAEGEYQEALRLNPEFADAFDRIGLVQRERGDLGGAVSNFERALALNPKSTTTYDNLAATLSGQGRAADAVACYQRGLAQHPERCEFHFGMGVLFQQLRQFETAETAYQNALRINPRHALAMNNLGTLLKDRGHLDEALARYRQAMQADPGLAEPYFNSALILSTRGQLEEALCAYRDALARKPNHFKAAVNCGSLLERFGRFDEALECYRQIVAAQPELSVGHFRLGNLYRSMGKMPESIAAYQEAIRLQPDYVFAYNNLAVAYIDLGEVDAAENCARKGLQYAPQQGELHSNLATALLLQGRLEESLAARRTAVELLPDSAGELGNLVYDLNLLPDTDPQKLFDEHLTWAARHAEPLTLAAPPFANRPDPNRRIRIGYVSPYFRQHAVNYFMEPVLVSHDHEQFEVICYSDVQTPDTTTERLKAAVSGWRDVRSLSDEQLAGAVREDGIDILVDLSGHIGSNRLPTFARRAAPVQVTYIGYQNTTGMSAMDYRVTDAYADPPGQTDRYYTEKLVRLPRTFFVYRAPDDSPPVSRLPALASGRVTFGSFNKYSKVTAPTLEVWLQILKRLPDSRLLVLAQREGHAQKRLEALAASRGVDPARIELFGQQPHTDYMRLIAQADIALDPMPFNGHTTTCDALWMGVPVITLAGTSYASRFGSSAHHSLGLESFVADSPQQYVEIAARTAADLPALAALRAALRLRMQDSPLSDFAGFTRNLEDAYREMWRTWCAEKSSSQSTGC